ncbi:hypothetical protein [Corynebacterium doosanense]|uniref:MarR family transcriptional regulator n=1 Tax=Corynebacterium doosanense CAU 212 = DSM 45436 TaxID=558173 RepID=A0A097IH62_9CORY|nr:hypothetical protein [Corynebacterium doosanense]AIT61449.1 MarR family transcriptional regulator [Corynebacterium doosanense CAU 212 = DSM 45436]
MTTEVATLKVWTTLYAAKARADRPMTERTLANITGYAREELTEHLAGLIADSYVRRRRERGITPDKDKEFVWLTDEGAEAFDAYVAELRRIAGR